MSTRLEQIEKRCGGTEFLDWESFRTHAPEDCRWFLSNTRNAIAYCDRILAMNPNGAELMFLGEVKRILTGASDGRSTEEVK